MSGSLGDMGNLLKQAQQMQRQLDRVRGELKEIILVGSGGGGSVSLRINGDCEVQALEIADELISAGDRAAIEESVLEALRDGIAQSSALRRERMSEITGGLNLPGMF